MTLINWKPNEDSLPHYIYEPVRWDITQEETGKGWGWYRDMDGSVTSKAQHKEEWEKKGLKEFAQLRRLEVFRQMNTDYNNVINEIKKPDGKAHVLTEKERVVLRILKEKWKVIVKEAFEQEQLNPDQTIKKVFTDPSGYYEPIERVVYPHRKIGIRGWTYGPLICENERCFDDDAIENSPFWSQCDFFGNSILECHSCWNS